ncbi:MULTISPECIES: adenosylcobinamide-GDP ribazoletransferase [Novosphingobium]|uniref:adenosylcobinamide-GDP ribazoletransferase n=1 Tax=Novosphingobium TaxID=165696 RepID=UPI0006D58809|nr:MULTISPECIES: adenosylcobinamide-GDP ribazoletransferase [Novosphingobium]
MRRFILAMQFTTRVPLPNVKADDADFAALLRYFPMVGLVVGAIVSGAWWLGSFQGAWLAALLALGAWVAVTGALHLDGLADVADATGAAHGNPARLSEVLADPHVGSFGVVVVVLQLLAKFVLLQHVSLADLPLLCILPGLARIGPLFWARMLPPLHEGLGSRLGAGVRFRDFVLWGIAALPVVVREPAFALLVPAIPLWSLWLRRRLGGISGDGHGAGIELCETALLAALVLT